MVDSSGSPKTASGTSFSTPMTAGVAALVLQAHPGYSAKQVQNAIRDSAHSVQSQSAYGEGLVDAVGAVKAAPGISFGSSSGTPDLMFIALIGIGAVVFFIPTIRKNPGMNWRKRKL
jgi:subtilisin family serine protease